MIPFRRVLFLRDLGRNFWLTSNSEGGYGQKTQGRDEVFTEPLVIHPNAAGLDIGATEIFVAVPY